MKSYDERLEDLLLTKEFAALSAEERAHVTRVLGNASVYSYERNLRLRSRALLGAEAAPTDPQGLANVMARVGASSAATSEVGVRRVPVWQAAAAALLLATLAWWGRGVALSGESVAENRLATADTVLREVRVVDTVYLPAPQAETHPLKARQESQATSTPKKVRRMEKKGAPQLPSKLASLMETMPDPKAASRGAGIPQTTNPRLGRKTAVSDGISILN